ncbi:MAG: hypothetical protein IJY31_05605 [Muribaculaceae bacterium]|nr:hypothetical protein [Muribaculaceae bacterium]
MRVVTLRQKEFEQACFRLAKDVALEYSPDVVIGILTGGGYLGRIIYDVLNDDGTKMYVEAEAHRPGHVVRSGGAVKKILAIMPRRILDLLRMLESRLLEWHYSVKSPEARDVSINMPENVHDRLLAGGCRILVVDDAIDSGGTMASVKDFLAGEYPGNEIKTAVITVTTASPVVEADFSLYCDRVLVRFPWSNDMK